MTKIEEIEEAIEALPERDIENLRAWFSERDWLRWDKEIEEDSDSGKLEFLVREAKDAKMHGKLGGL